MLVVSTEGSRFVHRVSRRDLSVQSITRPWQLAIHQKSRFCGAVLRNGMERERGQSIATPGAGVVDSFTRGATPRARLTWWRGVGLEGVQRRRQWTGLNLPYPKFVIFQLAQWRQSEYVSSNVGQIRIRSFVKQSCGAETGASFPPFQSRSRNSQLAF